MHSARSSAAVPIIVALCEQQILTGEFVRRHVCFQAIVCTEAVISKACTLPEAVLQCIVAGHCASSRCLNLTLQRHEPAFSLLSAQQL